MRFPLIAALLASALVLSSAARAGDAGCRSSVDIEVGETPFDPPLAKIVFSEVFHAVERSDVGCEDAAGARLSKTRVAIRWVDRDHAALEVEVADGSERRHMVRDVDLSRVARDARALAVTIATTEMIEELRAQVRLARTPPVAPVAIEKPSAPTRPTLAPCVDEAPTWTVTPALALDAFTRGLVLLGPETRVSMRVVGALRATIRFGTRAALGDDAPASGFVGGGAVELAWPRARRPWELAVVARLDAFSVPFEGSRRLHAVAGIGVDAGWRVGSNTRLVVGAGLGRALDAEDGSDRGPLAGIGISANAGLALAF